MKKAVKLIVFSAESDSIRQVEIVPDFDWGGEGCVGCDIGTGMLHWIPAESRVEESVAQMPTAPTTNVPLSSPSPVPSASNFPIKPPAIMSQPQPTQAPAQLNLHSIQAQSQQFQPLQSQAQNQPLQPPQPVQTIQPIAVAVPTSRPVFDNLSTVPTTSSVPSSQQSATMGPPIPQHQHQPQVQKQPAIISTAGFVIDDIPQPNFTVASDMFPQ